MFGSASLIRIMEVIIRIIVSIMTVGVRSSVGGRSAALKMMILYILPANDEEMHYGDFRMLRNGRSYHPAFFFNQIICGARHD